MSTFPTSLTCTSLSFAWPDGTTVFDDLQVAFGPGRPGSSASTDQGNPPC